MTRRFRPVELLTIGYAGFSLLVLFFGWKRAHNQYMHLGVLVGIIAALTLLTWAFGEESPRWAAFLRRWHPLFLLPYVFPAATQLQHVIFPQLLDPVFQRVDASIFGYQPTIEWGIWYDYPWLQELMHFAYFSFYIMIYGTGAILIAQKRGRDVDRFIFTLAVLSYSCYALYHLIPVAGGRYIPEMKALTQVYRYGPFTRIMAFVYRSSPHFGGAFPSSHVAVALGINLFAIRAIPKFGKSMLPITILLIVSTVYCHYHYFIDTVAGTLYGIGMFLLATSLITRFERRGITL
jgi:membrane-associated phospholipid phosphatase